MKPDVLTISVDYADKLAASLPIWCADAARVLCVTCERDRDTCNVCRANGAAVHLTDRFWLPGAVFNKAGALADGYAALRPTGWVLLVDADVMPPPGWWATIRRAGPRIGNLYGARRRDARGAVPDAGVVGFFMLFHASDPRALRPDGRIFGDWHNAGSYDSEFAERWPGCQRGIVPLVLLHDGEHGQNWCGLNNRDGMVKMWQQRRRNGWRAEQIG